MHAYRGRGGADCQLHLQALVSLAIVRLSAANLRRCERWNVDLSIVEDLSIWSTPTSSVLFEHLPIPLDPDPVLHHVSIEELFFGRP